MHLPHGFGDNARGTDGLGSAGTIRDSILDTIAARVGSAGTLTNRRDAKREVDLIGMRSQKVVF